MTLAFGEIFRIAMINLDGEAGPNITHGSNGIPAIPDLNFFGFDFGDPHVLLGIPLGRFSNYYFLLLVLIAFVILVFVRLNNSRIGRGWVAIREDEKAAEAMGVNVFGLKLFAFASGAFLAGVAGAVKAHRTSRSHRTSSSSWSLRSCWRRSCSAAWAPCSACSLVRRS